MTTAFIGAGQMGMPMVERLVAAEREVAVFARREEVRQACTAADARAFDDLAAAVAGADEVVLCLYSDAQVREVALGPGGLLEIAEPGALVISHTTGSPATVRSLAEEGAARGIRVVDAPVSGSAGDIARGEVTVLLGGETDMVERAAAIVAAYGDPIIATGPLGSAQLVKLLNNALFAANVQLAGQVERMAEGFGVDMADAAAAIQQCSGASYAMARVAEIGSAATLGELAGHFLHKDTSTIRDVARELDIDLGVLGQVHEQGPLSFEPRSG